LQIYRNGKNSLDITTQPKIKAGELVRDLVVRLTIYENRVRAGRRAYTAKDRVARSRQELDALQRKGPEASEIKRSRAVIPCSADATAV
jgi:hypothetical protein